ncbi:NAD(P)H-binding protein [Actinoplanes sp. NPDC051411]|uniref:NAD(P)H-binding protein n=1 Tax=Actinoplanes sp. NPDC051411 TaxID=3155522 RepID=UPI003447AC80
MTVLVTGATGNIGRMVVTELRRLGADDVRALTVDPGRAALPAGVSVYRGHLGRPSSIVAALEGADVMYLAPHLPTVDEVCRLAHAAGVRRIVDLVGPRGGIWQPIEDAVEASGIPWTHLEPGEFMSNATLWANQIRAGNTIRDAYPDATNAPIAQEDVAAAAAQILLTTGHEGKAYPLTGPAALSRREMIRLLGEALGRPLEYLELSRDQAQPVFEQVQGAAADWYLDGLDTLTRHPQTELHPATEITGRPATTYRTWARTHTDLFQ